MSAHKFLILQHHPNESAGMIQTIIEERGYTVQVVETFIGQAVPASLQDYAGLVVMGGPMSVGDSAKHPHLPDEIRLIQSAIQANRPVVGICLGSQLIATALGAIVKPGPQKEIGWYEVQLSPEGADDPLFGTLPSVFEAVHWHGDVYPLPEGAVLLASSRLTPVQAYRYGQRVYGLLFHFEVTAPILQGMVAAFEDELQAEGLSGSQILQQAEAKLPTLSQYARQVFTRWITLAEQS